MIANNDNTPATNGDGRNGNGRFLNGHKRIGRGNPYYRQLAKIRAVFHDAVTPEKFGKATEAVLRRAQKGDVMAYREICDRLFGKSQPPFELGSGGKIQIQVVYVNGSREHAND